MLSRTIDKPSPPAALRDDVGTLTPLLTDLYQLNMISAYYERAMEQKAVFEFFVRRLPPTRNYLVAAGLDQALAYLQGLRFSDDDIDWLTQAGRFKADFLQRLRSFRFTGDVYAMPEGTVFFADEPILQVIAPLPEAQLIESRLINILHFQTLIASKAARFRNVAGNRFLADFGMRRAHGAEAALLAARASYLGGFDVTSNVQAAKCFNIPLSGTMAHSFIQAHDSELEAFRSFARSHPAQTTLLIDTYDVERGARHAAQVAQELRTVGIEIQGVRIDSGDLCAAACRVRAILDQNNCPEIDIFVSGGMDENDVAAAVRSNAPIDGFGIGTSLVTSADAAALDCAYKLQQYAGAPRRKLSVAKSTWPGRKQVFRLYDNRGMLAMDVVGCGDEIMEGKLLLQPFMINGHRLAPSASLHEIRRHCQKEIAALPPALRALEPCTPPLVTISHGLIALAEEFDRALR